MTRGFVTSLLAIAAAAIAGGAAAGSDQAGAGVVRVVLDTDKGAIELEIDVARAPVTAANFLRYVDAALYDGGAFYRTVRPDTELRRDVHIQVIQGGLARGRGRGQGRRGFDPIPLERTSATGLRHLDGTVSMARSADPDSATSEFFICVGDQPELDAGGRRNPDGQGFAAFGRVASGMDAVRAIHASAVGEGETLDPPVVIRRAVRK